MPINISADGISVSIHKIMPPILSVLPIITDITKAAASVITVCISAMISIGIM